MSTTAGEGVEPSSRVARSGAIVFSSFDDATVMMDAEIGRYYEINPVGARIWGLAESGPQVAEVLEVLAAEYEVAPDTCRDEVRAFMDELLRLEVIRIHQRDETKVVGQDGSRDPETSSTSGKAAVVPRQGTGPGAKLAWTTPAIRVMEVSRTEAGHLTNTFEAPFYDPMT